MFTGLIEEEGKIKKVLTLGQAKRIYVETSLSLKIGDSIAVDGVCLTVEEIKNKQVQLFLSKETLNRTKFKTNLKTGQYVNLERALTPSTLLGGHLVSGHVDTTGTVKSIKKEGENYLFTFSFPREYEKYIVEKGSIAVDGVSLTVASVKPGQFTVQIIPHTFNLTTIKRMKPGDTVNLEFDMIGKYVVETVEKYLKVRPSY